MSATRLVKYWCHGVVEVRVDEKYAVLGGFKPVYLAAHVEQWADEFSEFIDDEVDCTVECLKIDGHVSGCAYGKAQRLLTCLKGQP